MIYPDKWRVLLQLLIDKGLITEKEFWDLYKQMTKELNNK